MTARTWYADQIAKLAKRGRDEACRQYVWLADYRTLERQLADMTADYHRWHDAYLRLKYPGMGERVAGTVACNACDGSGVTASDAGDQQ